MLRALVAATVMLVAAPGPTRAGDTAVPVIGPENQVSMAANFTDDSGVVSTNMSGIACMPETAGRRVCLAIDDESRSAQVAVLDERGLTPGRRIPLFGDEAPASIVGSPPAATHCPKNKPAFKDLDGEAVAYAAPYFYVAGSHGCSRHKGKLDVSSFITARLKLDQNGDPLGPDGKPITNGADPAAAIETTYRLSDALAAADDVGSSFATELQGPDASKDGMNIEGVAVVGDVLYAGLRAPSIDGQAYLVGAGVKALFAPGAGRLATKLPVIRLSLGQQTGIRDLSALPGGRLAILAGPTREDATPFSLFVAGPDLAGDGHLHPLARLSDVWTKDADGEAVRAKAEAILPVAITGNKLSAIVLFDGAPNGGAAEYVTPGD